MRITRETELLGGEISSTHSRENIVLRTKFLSKDLPYFTELLAEVATQTKFAGELVPFDKSCLVDRNYMSILC